MIIRKAEIADFTSVHRLILELAHYEKAPDEVITTPNTLSDFCLRENPFVFCWVAEIDSVIVGTAICYIRYSTWKGPVLYLEDIVVSELYRRKGVGSELLNVVFSFARENAFNKVTWQVLDWNELAIDFYKKFNANFDDSWVNVSVNL